MSDSVTQRLSNGSDSDHAFCARDVACGSSPDWHDIFQGVVSDNRATARSVRARASDGGGFGIAHTGSHWGEILVAMGDAEEARAIIADYLGALERGGVVRDEDIEGEAP